MVYFVCFTIGYQFSLTGAGLFHFSIVEYNRGMLRKSRYKRLNEKALVANERQPEFRVYLIELPLYITTKHLPLLKERAGVRFHALLN